jgi:plasmid stabilization system protein ParE
MRRIRLSKTYDDELEALLEQGIPGFGVRVVRASRNRVERAIEQTLVQHPRRPIDPQLGVCTYHVSKTPFVLLYDYDDRELRVHLIIHGSMDRAAIDLTKVVW